MVLYHSMVSILFVAVLPFLPLIWILSEKRRANLLQRLGLFTGFADKRPEQFRIWIHALSVGEVTSAVPLVRGLQGKRPGAQVVFTASTRTGFQTAHRLLEADSQDTALKIGYFPFDFWLSIRRVFSKIDPDLVILVETDLWPGFVTMAAKRGIPVVLANARLSSGAHKGYRRMRPLFGRMFATLSHIMAQTREDAQRFIHVGAGKDRVSVAGNIKFDRPVIHMSEGEVKDIRIELGLAPEQRAWVAGSTHDGEETDVVSAFSTLKQKFEDLKLIIAPRDPDRAAGLARELGRGGHHAACLSEPSDKKAAADIIVIDRLGVLMSAYAACRLAFVGGSLADQGGHNPLEPAMFGKPVTFGPHMEDFYEVAKLLVNAGGALQMGPGESLAKVTGKMLEDGDLMARTGQAAKQVFFDNCGAVARTIEILEVKGFV